ncbi:sugar phosphate isomerase/epimerase, partial [Mesorhizobium sp. M00.F.Ca.ET.149.01.1.1]
MLKDAEALTNLASAVGSKGIQVITGPISLDALDPSSVTRRPDLYRGVVGLPIEEQIDITASGLAAVADIAAQRNLVIYHEAMSWTQLNTLDR